jgi:hypothetical protein
MWKPKYFQETTKNSVNSTLSGSDSQICPEIPNTSRIWLMRPPVGDSTMVNSTPVITSDST